MISNTTWITQRNHQYKSIKNINWEQIEKDVYRLRVDLNYPQLWGYNVSIDDDQFILRIKRPPELPKSPESPVAGLTVAVEAGHGGPRNLGARGLSGSKEKEVNYDTAMNLVSLLEIAGATPVIVRKGDETISLQDRIQRAVAANADIYISIHANAAGSDRGYFRVEGVSTYYKYLPWKPLSKTILTRMEETGLYNWGNIGSFNYRPCLMTEMPSILVELGFMSHPGDEELLVDPEFQKKMAEAIFKGLEDYLETQRE